jgi:hypothetical protein
VRSTFLVLLLLAAPAAFAQSEGSARQVLEECVAEIEPDVIGLEDIEATCPDLRVALEELGLTDLVSENQLSLLSRDGLNSMLELTVRYQQVPEHEAIGTDTLAPLLDSLRRITQALVARSLRNHGSAILQGFLAESLVERT